VFVTLNYSDVITLDHTLSEKGAAEFVLQEREREKSDKGEDRRSAQGGIRASSTVRLYNIRVHEK